MGEMVGVEEVVSGEKNWATDVSLLAVYHECRV